MLHLLNPSMLNLHSPSMLNLHNPSMLHLLNPSMLHLLNPSMLNLHNPSMFNLLSNNPRAATTETAASSGRSTKSVPTTASVFTVVRALSTTATSPSGFRVPLHPTQTPRSSTPRNPTQLPSTPLNNKPRAATAASPVRCAPLQNPDRTRADNSTCAPSRASNSASSSCGRTRWERRSGTTRAMWCASSADKRDI